VTLEQIQRGIELWTLKSCPSTNGFSIESSKFWPNGWTATKRTTTLSETPVDHDRRQRCLWLQGYVNCGRK
jgi:hypothetical protein